MAKNSELSIQTLIASIVDELRPAPAGDSTMLSAHIVALFQDWYLKRWKYRAAKVGVDQFADSVLLFLRSHLT
jgi:hypothetical protein